MTYNFMTEEELERSATAICELAFFGDHSFTMEEARNYVITIDKLAKELQDKRNEPPRPA